MKYWIIMVDMDIPYRHSDGYISVEHETAEYDGVKYYGYTKAVDALEKARKSCGEACVRPWIKECEFEL